MTTLSKILYKANQGVIPNHLLIRTFVVATMLVVSGCSGLPQQVAEVERATGPTNVVVQTPLPNVDLDPQLLHELLLGELAVQRGQYETAAKSMAAAARASQDYRVAERATRIALRAKQQDLALEMADLWAQLEPEGSAPLEVIGVMLVQAGRVDEAQDKLTELVNRKSDSLGVVYRRLAELLSKQSNQAGAIDVMSALIELNPDNADAYFAQAYLAGQFDQQDLVARAIDRALLLRPSWEDAALTKASHLAIQKASKETVVDFVSQFLLDHPSADKLRLYYAGYLVDQQDFEQGFVEFETLIKRVPNNPDTLFAAGLLGLQLKRFDAAQDYLKRNLALRPGNDQTRLYLGRLAAERERYEEAQQWYSEVERENYYFEAQLLLAEIIAETQGLDAALARLLELHPNDQREYVRWVLTQETLLREGDELEKAKATLDVAVDRYRDDTELLYARGLLAAQLEQVDVLESDMRKLLVKDPQNAHALNSLGYTLADITDRYDEAHELIQQALAIRPDDPFILDSMGWVQYRMGNHQAAIDYLERAFAKREDAEIAAHLGEVLWIAGDRVRAKEIWQRAVEQYPDNNILVKTIEKFSQ